MTERGYRNAFHLNFSMYIQAQISEIADGIITKLEVAWSTCLGWCTSFWNSAKIQDGRLVLAFFVNFTTFHVITQNCNPSEIHQRWQTSKSRYLFEDKWEINSFDTMIFWNSINISIFNEICTFHMKQMSYLSKIRDQSRHPLIC